MQLTNSRSGPSLALAGLGAFVGMCCLSAAAAQELSHDAMGMDAQVLLKASVTVLDQPLTLPEKPEVTSMLVTIEPGGHSNLHQHPFPVVVYLMEGALETHIDDVVRTYAPGEVVIEPSDTWMQAVNPGDVPTKLLVVIMGEEGQPISVAAE